MKRFFELLAASAIVALILVPTSVSQVPNPAGKQDECRMNVLLSRTLDSMKAQDGDPLVLINASLIEMKGGLKIPENSKVIGRIVEARSKRRGSPDSHLTIAFDRVLLRDGRQVPIHAWVEGILAAGDEMSRHDSLPKLENASDAKGLTATTSGVSHDSQIKGIEIVSEPSAPNTVLRSSGENVRIESGAHLLLQVIQQ